MQTLKIFEKVDPQKDQTFLEYAIALNFDNIQPDLLTNIKQLSKTEKIYVTKLNKAINLLCNKHKQEVETALLSLENLKPLQKEFLLNIFAKVFNARTFNNYRFIRMFEDPQQLQAAMEPAKLELATKKPETSFYIRDYIKLEYKIELVLSSIAMKRVLRPLILLIFFTKQGTQETVYLNVDQFDEFRKNTAYALSLVHKVESIKNFQNEIFLSINHNTIQ